MNMFSEVFKSPQAMVEAFQEQLQLEIQGQVRIPSALPFFEEMLKQTPKIANRSHIVSCYESLLIY